MPRPCRAIARHAYDGRVERARPRWRSIGVSTGGVVALLAATTLLVAALERWVGVPDASATYLLAVLAAAMYLGTAAAVATAIGAFLTYNFLFVHPNFTFVVEDPGELLNLLLLLVLGIAVGQLASRQRSRAAAAVEGEREARALFRISRALATREDTASALGTVAETLLDELGLERVTVGLASPAGAERVVADTGGAEPAPRVTEDHAVLHRAPGDTPARWARVHPPGARASEGAGSAAYRVAIEVAGVERGSVWALRPRAADPLARADNRILAAAADQVGQALEQDRLAEEARAAEVARRGDELKTALLDSVSHDLRTPLATIRAAAGTILEGADAVPETDRLASAQAIDREAEHLNRLVTNLLDLSRVESGALRADLEAVDLADALKPMMTRYRARLAERHLELDLPVNLPPVRADAVFLDQVVSNLLENEVKFVAPGGRVRVRAAAHDGTVRLSVDDTGPGVPPDALPRLFEKFYRTGSGGRSARPGTGTGLAVVRGLTEAMGGSVGARTSDLGGLGIDVDLPAAVPPTEDGP
jgi:two-component system sensor histidine kinase KdpD